MTALDDGTGKGRPIPRVTRVERGKDFRTRVVRARAAGVRCILGGRAGQVIPAGKAQRALSLLYVRPWARPPEGGPPSARARGSRLKCAMLRRRRNDLPKSPGVRRRVSFVEFSQKLF